MEIEVQERVKLEKLRGAGLLSQLEGKRGQEAKLLRVGLEEEEGSGDAEEGRVEGSQLQEILVRYRVLRPWSNYEFGQ